VATVVSIGLAGVVLRAAASFLPLQPAADAGEAQQVQPLPAGLA
jgi:hypothetical protein